MKAAEPRTLTPRKAEVQAVAAVLDEDHDSAEAAGKAALKVAYRLFQERDWWAILTKEFGIMYGPYGSEAEAISKAEKGHSLGLGGELRVVKINSTLGQEMRVAQLDSAGSRSDPLCACGHLKSNHGVPGQKYPGCFSPAKECKCRRFKEEGE